MYLFILGHREWFMYPLMLFKFKINDQLKINILYTINNIVFLYIENKMGLVVMPTISKFRSQPLRLDRFTVDLAVRLLLLFDYQILSYKFPNHKFITSIPLNLF